MAGGVHGRGWGDMHGGRCVSGGCMARGVCMEGACMVGVCMAGGMHGRGCVCHTVKYGRSMHGRYASYWNAFLFYVQSDLAWVESSLT